MKDNKKYKKHGNGNNNYKGKEHDRNNRDKNYRDRDRDRSRERMMKDDFKFPVKTFRPSTMVTIEQIRSEESAINDFKANTQLVCSKCGLPIQEITQAVSGRLDGTVMHFDCVIQQLCEEEKLGDGEKITYIGQGRFGVLYFENPHDMKHFKIRKIIEWEKREEKAEFRNQMADLYSQVK